MIPTSSPSVNVANLDPVFAARLEAFLADPRLFGLLKVFSGVRTYASQKYLYDGWEDRLPGFNLAADPDAWITPRYGLRSARGSWHMEQHGLGFAVDLNFDQFCWTAFGKNPAVWQNRKEVCAYIETIAREYLLARTVPSEEWHYQMTYGDWTTVPQPKEWDDMATKEEVQQAAKEGATAALAVLMPKVDKLERDLRDLREQVSLGTKPPARTVQEAVGAIARKVGA